MPGTPAAYATEEQGKVQGRDCVDIVEGSCGYRALGVSIQRQLFYRETRGKGLEGVAMCLNVVLTRVTYPKSKCLVCVGLWVGCLFEICKIAVFPLAFIAG